MFDVNVVTLSGRLTKNPEIRYTSNNNVPVCNFSLAVSKRYAPEGSAEKASFIPVVLWNKDAEFAGKYYKKGSHIWISGELSSRTWDDSEGKKHYVIELIGDKTSFLQAPKKNNGESQRPDDQNTDDEDLPI